MDGRCAWVVVAVAWLACDGGGGGQTSDAGVAVDAGSADGAGCVPSGIEETMIDVGEVSLHVARQGCGPVAVVLHGFPEFSFTWDAIGAMLADELTIVAPDQRGYNLSEVPATVADYATPHLVADIAGLIDQVSADPVVLIAHDWGGAVAWLVAHQHPDKLRGLVILNAPHPDVFARELADNPDQKNASQYMNFFINPQAEGILGANDYQGMISVFSGALTVAEESRYRAGYRASGITGMLSWYRANIEPGPTPGPDWPTNVTIDVPTLVVWAMDDTALLPGNLDGLEDYVTQLEIQRVEGSDHWITHRKPDVVADAIRRFAAALP
jgi:pimeloyl-ACP methyl ester carboxylesterase